MARTWANRRTGMSAAARPRPWLESEWERVDWMWNRSTIVFMVPGQWRATWFSWTPAWELLRWLLNLEEPFRRTARYSGHSPREPSMLRFALLN